MALLRENSDASLFPRLPLPGSPWGATFVARMGKAILKECNGLIVSTDRLTEHSHDPKDLAHRGSRSQFGVEYVRSRMGRRSRLVAILKRST